MQRMSPRIELAIEKMNHGNWLKVTVPYITTVAMTATLHNHKGEMLRKVKLASGNNMIDIEVFAIPSIRIKIDTPYETLFKELQLD